MTLEYVAIFEQIDLHTRDIESAQTARSEKLKAAQDCLSRIIESANAHDVFELKADLDSICGHVAQIRDGARNLIAEQTLLQSWFNVEPVIEEEKKVGFFSKVFDRSKRDAQPTVAVDQPNSQVVFEKAKDCNTTIFSAVEAVVDFLDLQEDEFDQLVVEAKAKVIELNRSMDKVPVENVELISRLKGQTLEIEDAIAIVGKYLKEVTLLRREFQPIYDEIDYVRFVEQNDVVNVRHLEDVKRVMGKSSDDYAL